MPRDLFDELLPLFQSECEERLSSIQQSLGTIAEAGLVHPPQASVEQLLREMHSLKGAARAVNLASIEAVCHAFEQALVFLQNRELVWSADVDDTLQRAAVALSDLLISNEGDEAVALSVQTVKDLEELPARQAAPPPPPAPVVAPPAEAAMSAKEEELLRKLLPIFRGEAAERLEAIAGAVNELRGGVDAPRQAELFESMMRDSHSIKGGARTMKLSHASGVSLRMEKAAGSLMRGEAQPHQALFDSFERAVRLVTDLLEDPASVGEGQVHQMMEELEAIERPSFAAVEPIAAQPSAPAAPSAAVGSEPPPPSEPVAPAEVVAPFEAVVPPPPAAPTEAVAPPVAPFEAVAPPPPMASAEVVAPLAAEESEAVALAARATTPTVRVATERLENVFRQAQEMLAIKLAAAERVGNARELAALLREWRLHWSRVDTDLYRLQSWVEKHDIHSDSSGIYSLVAGMVRFLEWNQGSMRHLERRVRSLVRATYADHQSFGVMVDSLIDETKQSLMLPLSTLFKGLPRMVRDLARAAKKQIDFVVDGDEVEVDKRILDEMRDPLIHLLRNCVDHGIETPAERESRQKPKRGRIVVAVAQITADKVQIRVTDDGRGIDVEALRRAAAAQGALSAAQASALGRDELLQLIYRSGVSTAEQVSNVSGRGLGMSIGRAGVERLGGTIAVETRDGGGTSFRIVLPLTLATFRVLLVEVGRQTLALPTGNTDRVLRLAATAVQSVDGREAISVGGESVLLERLDRALGMEARATDAAERVLAVVLRSGERRAAFRVDRVLDEQEVLAKGMGSYLQRVRHFSGATILGTGRVVPIVSVAELIESARARHTAPEVTPVEAAVPRAAARPRAVLVVEDSITSRMLLKEILESDGYVVTTAINGAEAVAVLERQAFDLVVSDVEMPRMNGFQLTEAIRGDPRWHGLPVILVTGLEREAERKRGLDAGASEYIVKGSFETSNLLGAVRRLCGGGS